MQIDRMMEGFILAGGKSSRMGRAKAELMLGGKRLLERAAAALAPTADEPVTIVGTADGSFGLTVLADPEIMVNGIRASGALVGLYAALSAARSEWIAVIACDLPFVTGELFATLAEYRRADIDAVVPMQSDGRPQPLAALYYRARCVSAALAAIENGEMSMRALLGSIKTQFVPFSEFADMEHAERLFLNVNSPDDYRQAAERS